MKILVITNHSYMLWRFRKDVIKALQQYGEIVISTPFVGHEDDFKAMGCRCIETDVDRRGINPMTDLRLCKAYHRLIKSEKPDLVLTYSIKPNIYAGAICRFMGIKYFANVQGLGTAFQSKRMAALVSALYKFSLKKAAKVFFENQGNADVFIGRKIIKTDRIKLLNGAGIDLEEYAFKQYPDEGGETRFLYLGRIMKEKGMDELFEAAEKLKQEYGERVGFDFVGFFEDEYECKVNELSERGVIRFHGFRENPKPFYENTHCLVLPSYHEGMSNVLLEAAAMGRPLITSNIHGCLEAVEDGKTGYLCEVKNAADLYEKMRAFVELPYEEKAEMGRKSHEYVAERFDKRRVVEETVGEIMQR